MRRPRSSGVLCGDDGSIGGLRQPRRGRCDRRRQTARCRCTIADLVRAAGTSQGSVRAADIVERIRPLVRDLFIESNPVPVKAALAMMMPSVSDEVRLPLAPLSECRRTEKQLRQTMSASGLSEGAASGRENAAGRSATPARRRAIRQGFVATVSHARAQSMHSLVRSASTVTHGTFLHRLAFIQACRVFEQQSNALDSACFPPFSRQGKILRVWRQTRMQCRMARAVLDRIEVVDAAWIGDATRAASQVPRLDPASGAVDNERSRRERYS